jgi:hypothetical protein
MLGSRITFWADDAIIADAIGLEERVCWDLDPAQTHTVAPIWLMNLNMFADGDMIADLDQIGLLPEIVSGMIEHPSTIWRALFARKTRLC